MTTTLTTRSHHVSEAMPAFNGLRTRRFTVALIETTALLALAFLARWLCMGIYVHNDELFHILAAQSWLTDGSLRLVPGGEPYDRAWLFTYLVGGSFQLFGESVWAARLPAILAGALLIGAVFTWVRFVVGRGAAWLAALGMCFIPISLDLSVMTRFYTLQALAMWIVTMAVYTQVMMPLKSWARGLWAVIALGAAALAYHLQVTSLIGFGALALWAAPAIALCVMRWDTSEARARNLWIIAGVAAVGVAVAATMVISGWAGAMFERYRLVLPWAAAHQHDALFYHREMVHDYGWLWYLFPVALIVALWQYRRVALFCAAYFIVAFVVHSFAGMKADRYLYHAMPHFIIIWALATYALTLLLYPRLVALLDRMRGTRLSPAFAHAGAAVVLVIAAFVALEQMPGSRRAAQWMGLVGNTTARLPEGDWTAARQTPAVADAIKDADVIISSSPPKAIYYLQRTDVIGLSRNQLFRKNGDEFTKQPVASRKTFADEGAIDPRYQNPTVYTPEALRRKLDGHRSALIVSDQRRWSAEWAVPPTTVQWIERHAQKIELPKRQHMHVYYWQRPAPPAAARGSNPG